MKAGISLLHPPQPCLCQSPLAVPDSAPPHVALGAKVDGVSIPQLLRWVTGNWDPRPLHLRPSKAAFPQCFSRLRVSKHPFPGAHPAWGLSHHLARGAGGGAAKPHGAAPVSPWAHGDVAGAWGSQDQMQPDLSKGKIEPFGCWWPGGDLGH